MKFTKSKDGKRRATILIPYRIGRDEMPDLVAYALIRDPHIGIDLADGSLDPQELNELTRARVEQMCRETLRRAGHESYGYWGDDCTEDARDAIDEWVKEEVDRLFPELAP